MADTDILERPAAKPGTAPAGPGQADGNPPTNARGQYRAFLAPPAGSAAAARIAAAEAEIAAAEAEVAAAESLLAADAAAEGATWEFDWVPIVGWGAAGLAAGTAGYALYKLHKANQAKAKAEADKKKAEEDAAKTQGAGGGNGGNVQIPGYDPCDLQPYDKAKCPEKAQAHHVIADAVLRYGIRGSATRIPNAPTLENGLTICLNQTEHRQVHRIMDAAVAQLGRGSSTGEGTAPIDKIVDEAIKAIEEVKPECKGKFEKVRKQFESMGDQPGRTTRMPPKAGSPTEQTLKSGGAGRGKR